MASKLDRIPIGNQPSCHVINLLALSYDAAISIPQSFANGAARDERAAERFACSASRILPHVTRNKRLCQKLAQMIGGVLSTLVDLRASPTNLSPFRRIRPEQADGNFANPKGVAILNIAGGDKV
ncbi:MAG: hypothetical protein AB7P05_08245 [Hyphomonadaceae bacterium]